MAYVKTVEGEGTLLVDNVEYGPASYVLDMTQDQAGFKRGDGTLRASIEGLRAAARGAGYAIVKKDGGQEVKLIVTRYTMLKESADVTASGVF